MGTEGLNCFVCDAAAVGRYFTLATCRTQSSKIRIIEKLGQLVGDKYMVVISNDDIICRGCASMMNTLDRLEKEMNSLRSVVLRYLEKKYELEEDELSKQVTPQTNNNTRLTGSKKSLGTNELAGKKRKAASMDGDVEEWTGSEKDKKEGKANTWLQCDKCKYTTLYNSFMIHHVRKHNSNESAKKAGDMVDKPANNQVIISDTQKPGKDQTENSEAMVSLHNKMMEIIENQKIGNVVVEASEDVVTAVTHKDDALSDTSETVEMIAAEINDFAADDERAIIAANANAGHSTQQVDDAAAAANSAPPAEHVTLQVAPGDDSIDASSTICMVDENGMIVQKMEQAEDGTLYVQVMDNPDSTKQVLSVAEDGSVQMVEVMWDEMVNPEAVEDDNMSF
ncbi:uncharacterized protein LOC111059362 [Nilaparvata lugens]|uniref:uncharacterized protein LOC111059362 n=1 Tax=Nilaparvata lugens TaxID=108931 RepID=UPI00193EB480|nr:uncharacterized protein LOC111059362 [Nilaparvata lugens]